MEIPQVEGSSDRLCNAAARGDLKEVQMLLEAGVDPNGINSFGRTPLQVRSSGKVGVVAQGGLSWEKNGVDLGFE